MGEAYRPRLIDAWLAELFAQLPALLITGPRATGKTTTASRLAKTLVRLDDEDEAAAFAANPDAALRALPEPILLDEWQAVPTVLGAVKRAVDGDFRPGRFLLSGSVRADLQAQTWPGTGRVVPLRMFGLTERELVGRADGPLFLDRLAEGQIDRFEIPAEVPDLPGYLALALRGGFPEPALRLDGRARRTWLNGYLAQLLTRDALTLTELRDPARLRRYFEALALNSAGLAEHQTIYTAAGIDRKTALEYDRLLTNLFVVDPVPAWTTNRLSRLTRTPKRYLVDPSLLTAALRLDLRTVMRDGDLFGRLLDTFVMAQLRPEVEVSELQPRLYHLREKDGRREVDVIGEFGTGIVAIEIKATAGPKLNDAAHLVYLRDKLGERFLGGAVLHTGRSAFTLSDRIFALPICALWGPSGA